MVAVIQEFKSSRPRALVVDDSRIARYVLYGLLDRLGFEVDLADSAELAVRQLGSGLPDVVFMDHLLPGMDGLECVRRLRAQPRSTKLPIVMYTSQDTDTFAGQAKAAGADDVFFKTGETGKLEKILRRLDLLPDKQQTAGGSKVVPMLRGRGEDAETPRPTQGTSRADLLQTIGPLVQAQHEKLRQDLLAEFVILERYEERMREDLFARLEELVRESDARLEQALERRRDDDSNRTPLWRRCATAASWLLILTLGLALGLTRHPGDVEASGGAERTRAALEAQAAMLSEVRRSVEQLSSRKVTTGGAAVAAAVPRRNESLPPDAATALITELQSMGILGQVRIETSAGAFCIRASGDGFMLEPAGRALQDCEVLPLYTAGLLQ